MPKPEGVLSPKGLPFVERTVHVENSGGQANGKKILSLREGPAILDSLSDSTNC